MRLLNVWTILFLFIPLIAAFYVNSVVEKESIKVSKSLVSKQAELEEFEQLAEQFSALVLLQRGKGEVSNFDYIRFSPDVTDFEFKYAVDQAIRNKIQQSGLQLTSIRTLDSEVGQARTRNLPQKLPNEVATTRFFEVKGEGTYRDILQFMNLLQPYPFAITQLQMSDEGFTINLTAWRIVKSA